MKLVSALLIFAALLAGQCHAEPRWCTIAQLDGSNRFFYPPIARAARVHGVVLSRLIYVPSGKVVRVESISGPRLLSTYLEGQLRDWMIHSIAQGEEECETLIIAEYKLLDGSEVKPEDPKFKLEPSVLRLSMETIPIPLDVVISDPAPLHGFKLFRTEVKWKLRRVFAAVFSSH